MGSIHNELNRGSFSKAVKNALGVDTTEPGVERFGETLTPTMNIWELPEWRLLRSEVMFSRTCTSPAVAARLATVQLINLAASKTLAVIESIEITGSGVRAMEIAVEQGDTTLGLNITNLQGVSQDTRYPLLGEVSQLRLHTADVAVGLALPQYRVRLVGNSMDRFTPGFVMNPNSKLLIFSLVVNQDFDCNIRWRERAAFTRELGVSP